MFDQTFINAQAQTRRPWTVLASLTLQTMLVAFALLLPLLHVPKLEVPTRLSIQTPLRKIDITVKPDVRVTSRSIAPARNVFVEPVLHIPTTVPTHIVTTPDPPSLLSPAEATPGASVNALAGLVTDIPAQSVREPVKPPSTPVTPARAAAQVHVGGDVQAAKLIFSPRPAYPPIAKATRTQGSVVIRAVISRDGNIGQLQLLSGPPLLVQAAMDAVRQWRYRPTSLNGEPVEVLTEITVNFTLSQ